MYGAEGEKETPRESIRIVVNCVMSIFLFFERIWAPSGGIIPNVMKCSKLIKEITLDVFDGTNITDDEQ